METDWAKDETTNPSAKKILKIGLTMTGLLHRANVTGNVLSVVYYNVQTRLRHVFTSHMHALPSLGLKIPLAGYY